MDRVTSRRGFLSAKILREDGNIVRPPGACVSGFADACTKCAECVSACPEGLISMEPGGYPVFKPNDNPCTFCGECARACPTDALDIEGLADWPWRAAVQASSCLSMNGVSCRICQDNCDQNALRFKLQTGGRAEPALDSYACNGCGSCVALCPVDAIMLERRTQVQMEPIQ
ncbi:ferredoxin-type protein NapF [Ruegeria sp. THAF57]|uniref:ferredoxin-type protein NapF n=1 Tax=Ruegeria sp. THAF57 TaxID=2744555 RepID=UPI0015DF88BB|nr:ferredoxin-type protein NapF [Ruegeria sp. THAF57]